MLMESLEDDPSPARRVIERRMRQLHIEPLDSARGVVRIGLVAAGSFMALFVAYGTFAPISSAATVSGQMTVAGDKIVVQPRSSGVVTQVLAHEGDDVRAGQPLIRLDPLRASAQLQEAEARYDQLRATEARLLAETGQNARLTFPADLVARADKDGVRAAILGAERAIYVNHQSVLSADRQLIRVQLISARAQQVATRKQSALINDELSSYRDLYDKGFARKTTVRSLERTAAQLQADTASGAGTVQQAAIQQVRTAEAQRVDAENQLATVREQLAQLGPQLAVVRDTASQTVIRAPAAGKISGLVDLGPGMILGFGKTLMEVVPTRRTYILEAQLKPADVDDVRVGQPATIRFSTVNPHGRTSFPGHVITVSSNRVGAGAGDHYRARIVLDDPAGAARAGLVLSPGIPASANIKTKSRTLFGFLFTPFADAISRSMREP